VPPVHGCREDDDVGVAEDGENPSKIVVKDAAGVGRSDTGIARLAGSKVRSFKENSTMSVSPPARRPSTSLSASVAVLPVFRGLPLSTSVFTSIPPSIGVILCR
jgi:hypothetical protein